MEPKAAAQKLYHCPLSNHFPSLFHLATFSCLFYSFSLVFFLISFLHCKRQGPAEWYPLPSSLLPVWELGMLLMQQEQRTPPRRQTRRQPGDNPYVTPEGFLPFTRFPNSAAPTPTLRTKLSCSLIPITQQICWPCQQSKTREVYHNSRMSTKQAPNKLLLNVWTLKYALLI